MRAVYGSAGADFAISIDGRFAGYANRNTLQHAAAVGAMVYKIQ